MLNWIFLILIAGSVLTAAFTGSMGQVSHAMGASAKDAVDLALGLVGQMALWLGVMHILKEAGLLSALARAMKPIMVRLFPEVPADHPAMAAMILNLSANMLGLANAATPFGLKAMVELNRLNKKPGVSTNAMALFLAMNTSGVAVLPLGVVAARSALGATNVGGIVLPSILATMCSTLVAIFVCKSLERLGLFSLKKTVALASTEDPDSSAEDISIDDAMRSDRSFSKGHAALAVFVFAIVAVGLFRTIVQAEPSSGLELVKLVSSDWTLPMVILTICLLGLSRRVPVYEAVVAGAKDGFKIAVMIIPFLVTILVAIGMFRASGAMGQITGLLGPVTGAVGLPAEALPMALLRPLSGSGAFGVMNEIMKTHGPDSFVGFLVSIMSGSTETTFYVLALYFGAVRVTAARHTVFACLAADAAGITAAVAWAHLFY